MANTKSAKKRILVSNKKALQNKMIKSRTKTVVKKAMQALESNDSKAASENVLAAISGIDRAVTKGILHKNTGSRKKSQLVKRLNKIAN